MAKIMPRSVLSYAVALVLGAQQVSASTAVEWRGKNIYQIMTDRFWRTDNSVGPA
jgi:hypothetical protein